MKTLSVSQVSMYNTCPYKWYLRYGQRLELATIKPGSALLGDAVHRGVAAYLKERAVKKSASLQIIQDAVNEFAASVSSRIRLEDKADADSLFSEAVLIAQRLVKEVLRDYEVVVHDGTPMIEFTCRAPLSEDIEFVGVVDAVLRSRHDGCIYLVDWKVRSRFLTMEEMLNEQIALYAYALKQMGISVTASVIYQVKAQSPAKPSLNLDGSMSRRKIFTTWDMYKEALIDAGLNPDDYTDMQEKLSDTELSRIILVPHAEDTLAVFWDNLTKQVFRMIENAGREPYRNYGYPCRSCEFAPICTAQLYKHDLDEVMNAYLVREDSDVNA